MDHFGDDLLAITEKFLVDSSSKPAGFSADAKTMHQAVDIRFYAATEIVNIKVLSGCRPRGRAGFSSHTETVSLG